MADLNKFIITNWCGVPHKFIRHADGTLAVDRFEEVLASGINTVPFYDYGYKTNCEALAACHRLGLKVILSDERIDKALILLNEAFSLASKHKFSLRGLFLKTRKVDEETIEKKMKKAFGDDLDFFVNLVIAFKRRGSDITTDSGDIELKEIINSFDTPNNTIPDVLNEVIDAAKKYRQAVECLKEVVRDYAAYPALLGYHIVDEPNSSAFPALAEIREIFSELDPAHESYINLFPNYASLEMLGNPSYYDHLEQFIRVVFNGARVTGSPMIARMAIDKGIPAVCIGRGYYPEGVDKDNKVHNLAEKYPIGGAFKGVQETFLVTLLCTGVEGVDPIVEKK